MKTSASQFILWMEYLEWETNAFDKTCYYLAQIAAEIRRSYVKRGVIVRIEDFILKFTSKRIEEKTPMSMDSQTRANKMKQFFFALTGLTGSAKKRKGRS